MTKTTIVIWVISGSICAGIVQDLCSDCARFRLGFRLVIVIPVFPSSRLPGFRSTVSTFTSETGSTSLLGSPSAHLSCRASTCTSSSIQLFQHHHQAWPLHHTTPPAHRPARIPSLFPAKGLVSPSHPTNGNSPSPANRPLRIPSAKPRSPLQKVTNAKHFPPQNLSTASMTPISAAQLAKTPPPTKGANAEKSGLEVVHRKIPARMRRGKREVP